MLLEGQAERELVTPRYKSRGKASPGRVRAPCRCPYRPPRRQTAENIGATASPQGGSTPPSPGSRSGSGRAEEQDVPPLEDSRSFDPLVAAKPCVTGRGSGRSHVCRAGCSCGLRRPPEAHPGEMGFRPCTFWLEGVARFPLTLVEGPGLTHAGPKRIAQRISEAALVRRLGT